MIVFAPNSVFVFLAAVAAAAGMWRLYRHGHPHLRLPFVWLLPLLRAIAVFLAILALSTPLLHRSVQQQVLSRLRFVVDDSASMLVTDADMPSDQKVEIAIAHGWMEDDVADLADIRRIAKLRAALRKSTQANASLDQARVATRLLSQAELGELSRAAGGLLREDWVPSVARRRQVQVNAFAQQLANREQQLRAAFREQFKGDIPNLDRQSRLQRAEHLLEMAESIAADHDISIQRLGQSQSLTDLSAIAPPDFTEGQSETIILLSDGQHHADSKPEDAATLWGNAGAQLITVGIGSTVPRTDLILLNTYQPRRAAPGDLISGALEIYDSMPGGKPLVLEIRDESTMEVVWSDEIETTGEGARIFSFAFRIQSEVDELPLLVKLTASIGKVDGEARNDNNRMPMPVFLSAPPLSSMFVVDGRPRWDSRYLNNIFRGDPSWRADANFAPQEEVLPDEKTLKGYDLLVLGEVPGDLVSDQHLRWIEEHVRSGAGLILMDGPREELRDLLTESPLSPVTWFDAPQWLEQPHLALTREGSLEPALTLAPNKADNEAIWSYLPSPQRAIRTRPKGGATILAEARSETGNTPLLVTQRLGDGRVLYIASDESWRWRYQKGDEYHTRYWQQLARWVMADPFLIQTEPVEFDLDRLRIRQGETAMVRARFDEPRSFEAVVRQGDTEVLRTDGPIENLEPGDYEVVLSELPESPIPFTVIEPTSIESTVTHANPRLLERMAERGNGMHYEEHEFRNLLSSLGDKRAIVTKVESISLWQTYGWLAAVVLLVAIELSLRKRAGLI